MLHSILTSIVKLLVSLSSFLHHRVSTATATIVTIMRPTSAEMTIPTTAPTGSVSASTENNSINQ